MFQPRPPRLAGRYLAGALCGCILLVAQFCGGAGLPQAFDAGNILYEQGKYPEAAEKYQELLRSGFSAPAGYYNLGNAWFKSGEIGRAIAAYRRAERLAPRDPDVRDNLRFARERVSGPTVRAPLLLRWTRSLTANEWTIAAASCLWGALLMVALIQWKPVWKGSFRVWMVGAALGFVVCAAGAGASLRELREVRWAVVIADTVGARHGPLDESQPAFTVHDGAELRLVDQKGEWVRVSAGAKRVGWLRKENVVLL